MNLELIGVAVVGLCVGGYVLYGYNDLATRWERLRRLCADTMAAKDRRLGVSHAVAFHLGRATGHERNVTRLASRRGRSARWVSDLSNGWPGVSTTSVTTQGLGNDVQSHNLENQSRLILYREAELYNTLNPTYPRRLVAEAFGFRPWRMGRTCGPPLRNTRHRR